MQKLKGLKNTLYKELLSGYTLEFFRDEIGKGNYSIKCLPGKTFVTSQDELGEINALSLLNALDFSEWKNFEGVVSIKKNSRALFLSSYLSKEWYESVARQVKKLGFTHFITKVQDEELKVIINNYGLQYGYCGLEGDFVPDFYYYAPTINNEKEFLYEETLVKDLKKLQKTVWFRLPKKPLTDSILRKVDLYNTKACPLVLHELSALRNLKKIGSPLFFKIKVERPLWPLTSVLESDSFLTGLDRHPIEGLIVETPLLPKEKSFLEMQLWAVSQVQIRGGRIETLMEAWLYRKGVHHLPLLKKAHEIAKDLELLKEDPHPRLLSSKILCDIQILEEKLRGERELKLFLLDARRILAHFLQENSIHLPQVLREEDYENSFYTEAHPLGGSSLKTSSKIILKDHSQTLKYEGELKALYMENSLF